MILAALSVLVTSAHAGDTWTDPLPGVRQLRRTGSGQQIHALVIDLCHAGVAFRATDSDERRRTTSSFGRLVGADAAVNGDFFSYDDYDVSGLAVGDGNAWSGVYEREGSVAFGNDRVEMIAPGVLSGALPWMREVVSGKPLLVDEGVAQTGFGSWSACDSRNPRTIYALSQDRRELWLVVVDGRSSSAAGMTCDEEAALMAGFGVDRALNMDGGGSSTMWVDGTVVNDPSDGSERTVGNHLAIYADGSGGPGSCDLWQDLPYAQAAQLEYGGTDLDGDGLPDFCARAGAGLRCYPARPAAGGTVAWGEPVQTPLFTDAEGWDAEPRYASIRFADVTGDGRADVCGRAPEGVRCWPSLGADSATGALLGFGEAIVGPSLTDADGWTHPRYGSTLRTADVDGDGRYDLCARMARGVRCWRSTGDGFDTGFDGPELSDDAGWSTPSWYGTLRVGDVDGDHRDDLCARSAEGVTCWASAGDRFGPPLQGPAWSDAEGWGETSAWGTIRVVDLDRDGRADLCGRNAAGLWCHRSNGEGGFALPVAQPDVTDARGWGDDDNAYSFRFGDLDADGDLDVCARANAGVVCWPYEHDAGAFGARFDGPVLSNAAGWDTLDTWPSLALLDLTGDGRAELLGRAPTGVDTWAWDGAAWAAAVNGPRLTASWAPEEHASTLRVVAPPYRAPLPGGDTSDPSGGDTGRDTAADTAVDTDPTGAPGDSAALPGTLAPLSGAGTCGCASRDAGPGGGGALGGTALLPVWVALAWARRRR